MSVKLMSKVFASSLAPNKRLVMLALADYASDDGKSIYPSQETLGLQTGLTSRSIRSITKELETDKIIKRVGRTKYATILYEIDPEILSGFARDIPEAISGLNRKEFPVAPEAISDDPLVNPSVKPSVPAREKTPRAPDPKISLPKVSNEQRSALEKTFTEITGLHPPPNQKEAGKRWWTPLREMIQEANGQAEFSLRAAVKQMSKDGLTFDSPASVHKTFRACLGLRNLSGMKSASSPDPFAALHEMLERQEHEKFNR